MMGLERLIRKTYGTVPSIDLDRKILQARVPRPTTFDFPALVDGIQRANVGTAAIEVEVSFTTEDGHVVIPETGQRLKLEGAPGSGNRLRILDWGSPDTLRAEIARHGTQK